MKRFVKEFYLHLSSLCGYFNTVGEYLSIVTRGINSFKQHTVFRENLPLIAIVWLYICITFTVQEFFGIHGAMQLKYYSNALIYISIIFSLLFFILHIPNRSYRNYLNVNYPIGFMIVLIHAPLFINAFASFKQTIPLINDFSWDYDLMRLDQILHFGYHPWRLLEPILNFPNILRAIDVLYMLWFLFLFLSFLWMGWTKRRRLRLHFFACTLLVWSLLGSGMGTFFSSAGPCYYSQVISTQTNPYESLMFRLESFHKSQFLWAVKNQTGLWQAKQDHKWIPFGGISAMPSIHLAMAVVFAMLAWNVSRLLGILFTLYVFIMQIGSVILGWHYAIDGYVGISATLLIWKALGRILDRYKF